MATDHDFQRLERQVIRLIEEMKLMLQSLQSRQELAAKDLQTIQTALERIENSLGPSAKR